MVAMPNCAEGGLCASLPLVSISGMATTTKTPWARKFDTGGRVRQTPAERLADTHTKAEGQRVAKATTVTALNSRAALGVAPPSNMISYVMPPNAIDATSSTGTAQSPIQRRSRAPAAWHAAAGLQGATSQRRCRCSWWRSTWRHDGPSGSGRSSVGCSGRRRLRLLGREQGDRGRAQCRWRRSPGPGRPAGCTAGRADRWRRQWSTHDDRARSARHHSHDGGTGCTIGASRTGGKSGCSVAP
jgi:hypothetical protein